MTRPPLQDQAARDTIATALDETLVVEAAAGTGKTTELVRRIVAVLATGHAPVSGIVAVTFTEKAAGELKLRLRQALEDARGRAVEDAPVRSRLAAALANLEEAHIGTIHGFCADLLREFPVEAGVDPLFPVLTEAQARARYADAFAIWLQGALEDAPAGVRRALRRPTWNAAPGAEADGPVDRLRRAGWDLVEWRDFPASWDRPPFERQARVDALVGDLAAFAALTARGASRRDPLLVDTAPARRAAADLRVLLDGNDYDGAEAVLAELGRDRDFRRVRKGRGAEVRPGVRRDDVLAAYETLRQTLEAFAADADADLAALLREELRAPLATYEQAKQASGALDFLDLLLEARDLVRQHDDVRRTCQGRFRCLFVDEFQDTDPLQAEILLLLAADDPAARDWHDARPVPGKLFIVGDPKQSIYRFRRADVSVYHGVCRRLAAHGARVVRLTTSFRSAPNLQRALNAAFAPLMTGDAAALQADYVPLTGPCDRRDPAGQPTVVALPVPRPYGRNRKVAMKAVDESLPDAVGAFVEWLIRDSGWTVTERRRPGVPVAIAPRHVCLLFRRFVSWRTDVTRAYMDALEARGIRHLLVGGRAFHDREEIETLRAALAAVEWPDDELAVFAALRGALFALDDERLLEYRHLSGVKGFRPFGVPDEVPSRLAPVAEALQLLAELHRGRNHHPVSETVTRLLTETRAHVGFALRNAGEQVLANVLHVGELGRQYEQEGGISFRGFVDALQVASTDGQAAEAPVVEDGSDGVRLMTVHKAKGLEFPVVILADPTAKLAPAVAARHLDADRGLCAQRLGGWSPWDLVRQQALEQTREEAEGVRLAYVAATRARDLLVVPAVGDQPLAGGWTSPLDEAIYPPPAVRRIASPASGCPPFRKDSVLDRPGDEIARPDTVAPGGHRLGAGTDGPAFDVVWWDPAALRLDVEAPFGLRREELIAKDVAPEVVVEGQRAYRDWRQAREAALALGRTPSLAVRTVTEWATGADPLPLDVAVEVVSLPGEAGRPTGARFGTLVHETLALVPLDADAGAVARVCGQRARVLGATDTETAAARDAVVVALAHPVLAGARAAASAPDGWCLRETPATLTLGSTLVEGVIDCVFAARGQATVVDFKTDRAAGADLDGYRRQVAFYAAAVRATTDGPVRAVLLQV